MNEEQLKGRIKSVGKGFFVWHFDVLKNYANEAIDRDQCLQTLQSMNPKNEETGTLIRMSNAKAIFNAGKECGALRIISPHPKLLGGEETITKAKELMKKYCK